MGASPASSTRATLAGAPFLRIDVPAVEGHDGDDGQMAWVYEMPRLPAPAGATGNDY